MILKLLNKINGVVFWGVFIFQVFAVLKSNAVSNDSSVWIIQEMSVLLTVQLLRRLYKELCVLSSCQTSLPHTFLSWKNIWPMVKQMCWTLTSFKAVYINLFIADWRALVSSGDLESHHELLTKWAWNILGLSFFTPSLVFCCQTCVEMILWSSFPKSRFSLLSPH